MSSQATYVFFELGTTWFEDEKSKRDAKILELIMVAITRDKLLDVGAIGWPLGEDCPKQENLQKLTLRHRQKYSTEPCDFLYNKFSEDCFNIMDRFFNGLTEPIYMIAHNGFDFDFFLLKRDLNALGLSFTKDIMCADSLYAFHDIHANENQLQKGELETRSDETALKLRQANADRVYTIGHPRKEWDENSYALQAVFAREFGSAILDTNATVRCDQMMQIAVKWCDQFVAWVDINHSSFAEHVKPLVTNEDETKAMKIERSGVVNKASASVTEQ